MVSESRPDVVLLVYTFRVHVGGPHYDSFASSVGMEL